MPGQLKGCFEKGDDGHAVPDNSDPHAGDLPPLRPAGAKLSMRNRSACPGSRSCRLTGPILNTPCTMWWKPTTMTLSRSSWSRASSALRRPSPRQPVLRKLIAGTGPHCARNGIILVSLRRSNTIDALIDVVKVIHIVNVTRAPLALKN